MQHYVTNPQVIHETIEGETIIIDLATGTYFSLQGAAPAIWNGLSRGRSDQQIVADMEVIYDAEGEQLGEVVAQFLRELQEVELIAPSHERPGEAAPPLEPGPRGPFVAPKLERYTDMQDIILLDPVHKVDSQGWPHAAPSTPGPA